MNSPLRSAINFCVVAMILISIVGCQKENLDAPTSTIQQEPPNLLQLDSIVAQSIELDQLERIPFEVAQKNAVVRAGKTVIISGSFNLRVFTTLDYYFVRDQIKPDRRYTSIVTPIHGDPNLSVRSFKASRVPPYRMIRSNYSNTIETVSFTKADLLPSERELNFVVQGPLGTTFKWEIYSELIIEPDIDENVLIPCTCGQEETETIICENFENLTAGLITGQTDDLVSLDDRNTLDAVVMKQAGFGLNSESALMLLDAESVPENQLNTEVNINLGDENDGTFLFSWSMLIPVNGTAEFDAPAFGGKFKLEGNGRGTLNLFDRYTLNLNYPSGEWLPIELGYEPHRGLYRIKIQDKIYYWLVSGADNTLDYFRFYGTPSGYRIDNICFERYVD